jgi:hypothetical protein
MHRIDRTPAARQAKNLGIYWPRRSPAEAPAGLREFTSLALHSSLLAFAWIVHHSTMQREGHVIVAPKDQTDFSIVLQKPDSGLHGQAP